MSTSLATFSARPASPPRAATADPSRCSRSTDRSPSSGGQSRPSASSTRRCRCAAGSDRGGAPSCADRARGACALEEPGDVRRLVDAQVVLG
jgi:hypothetical protein